MWDYILFFTKKTPACFLDRNYTHFKAGLTRFKTQSDAQR